MAAAVVAFLFGGALVARQVTQRGRSLISGPIRKFMLCLGPSLLAGAVLTFVLWRADMERLVPGMWLLLYGCAVIACSTVTNSLSQKLIASMGAMFVLLGVAAFAAPPALQTAILGVGFGVLHLVFGMLIGRQNHGE